MRRFAYIATLIAFGIMFGLLLSPKKTKAAGCETIKIISNQGSVTAQQGETVVIVTVYALDGQGNILDEDTGLLVSDGSGSGYIATGLQGLPTGTVSIVYSTSTQTWCEDNGLISKNWVAGNGTVTACFTFYDCSAQLPPSCN